MYFKGFRIIVLCTLSVLVNNDSKKRLYTYYGDLTL